MVATTRSRQGLRAGPVTGPLDRPSQGAPENRKASELIHDARRPVRHGIRSARRTVRSIHVAEDELQAAAQAAERRRALAAVDAGLRSKHASRVAAVVSRFADRRAALAYITDTGTRAAMIRQIAAEEANELARLAVEHAAEKRHLKRQVLTNINSKHRELRRRLRQRQRHQRASVAVQLRWLAEPRLQRANKGSQFKPRHDLSWFKRH